MVESLARSMGEVAGSLFSLCIERNELLRRLERVDELLSNFEADPDQVLRAIAQVIHDLPVEADLTEVRAWDYESEKPSQRPARPYRLPRSGVTG